MTDDVKASGPKISVPEAPDFEAHIPELLKKGCVRKSAAAEAKYVLDRELKLAWAEGGLKRELQQKPPSAELFKQLTNSIRRTQGLLRQLEGHPQWRNIGFDLCAIGEGTISIESAQELMTEGTIGLPRNPPPLGPLPEVAASDTLAMINRRRVLDRLLREIAHKPTRKRGNQEELDKSLIVARAVSFLQRYSSKKPTTSFDGPCVKFCKHFYEIVTGVTLSPSGLDKQIRKELKRSPRAQD
jgi:hypothetical protein